MLYWNSLAKPLLLFGFPSVSLQVLWKTWFYQFSQVFQLLFIEKHCFYQVSKVFEGLLDHSRPASRLERIVRFLFVKPDKTNVFQWTSMETWVKAYKNNVFRRTCNWQKSLENPMRIMIFQRIRNDKLRTY